MASQPGGRSGRARHTLLLLAVLVAVLTPAGAVHGVDAARIGESFDEEDTDTDSKPEGPKIADRLLAIDDGGDLLDDEEDDEADEAEEQTPEPAAAPPVVAVAPGLDAILALPFTNFPVVGTASYSDSFGAPRSGGRSHKGVDIFAEKLTPVVAVAAGTVVKAEASQGRAGVYVKIRHEDGSLSYYIHLNNDSPGTDDGLGVGIADGITNGVWVEAGTIIGYVGDSGNAEDTPPHLHFEYHPTGGEAINPYPLLQVSQGNAITLVAETLPFTGLATESLAWLASILALLGASLVAGSRRWRRAPDNKGLG